MIRCTILAMLLIVSPALAEPIPKESEAAKIKRVWGELVDEDGGTKLKLKGDKLYITLPAGDRTLSYPKSTKQIAPHLVKRVSGDFQASVIVHHSKLPVASYLNNHKLLGGLGLIVIFDTSAELTFSRVYIPNTEDQLLMRSQKSVLIAMDGVSTFGNGLKRQDFVDPLMLRVNREAELIQSEYSLDQGNTWGILATEKIPSRGVIKVGVYAEHSISAETTAVFEDLKITKPKK